MIPSLEFETILGEVVAKSNHYQAVPDGKGGKRIIKDNAIKSYERDFCRQIKIYKGRRIAARFALFVDVYYCNPRHDLDNSLKTILDCLQYSGAIQDDKYCIEIHATKHFDKHRPRVIFAIQEFEPCLSI